jgi:enoyl-CoA hydratase
VSEALPTEEALRSSAMKMARSIAAKSTLAVSGTKEVLLFQRDHGRVDDSLRYVASLNASILPDNEDVKSILRDARGRSGTSTQQRTQQRSRESTFSSKL